MFETAIRAFNADVFETAIRAFSADVFETAIRAFNADVCETALRALNDDVFETAIRTDVFFLLWFGDQNSANVCTCACRKTRTRDITKGYKLSYTTSFLHAWPSCI